MEKEIFHHKDFSIEVTHTDCCENPREWASSTLVTAHHRYTFGGEQLTEYGVKNYYAESIEEAFQRHLLDQGLTQRDIIAHNVYLYDHSGLALSTGPFSCSWDSGPLGFIYETRENIRKEFGIKRISPKLEQQILDRLRDEIQLLEHWANGSVYGFTIPDLDESLCGFYGWDYEENGLLDNARDLIDWHIQSQRKSHFERLKKLIKSGVPLPYRPVCPVFG